jgi:uncharacterized protein YjbI with pentapeptide repeats
LRYARLQGADLRNVELQGTDLGKAQLQGADLWEVQLQGAYVEKSESLNFKQRIEQQIDKETESQNLEEQYKTLNDTNKSQLIAELKAINDIHAVIAISRIRSVSETLNLSRSITGKYSQEEANKWLNDYKKVKNNGF